MIDTHKQIATRFLPVLFGLGVAAIAAGTVLADKASATDVPFACEIRETPAGSMVTVEPVVDAPSALSGTYAFTVKSASGGGSSNIRQGGGFSAASGQTMLGKVMLGASGVYEATLEVTANGHTVRCADRVGGGI